MAQVVWDNETGQWLKTSEAEAQVGIADGSFGLPAGEIVQIKGREDGRVFEISTDELPKAMESKKFDFIKGADVDDDLPAASQAEVAGLGFAKAASLGASDILETAPRPTRFDPTGKKIFEQTTREERGARLQRGREQNPVTNIASQVAGEVALFAATGGLGTAAAGTKLASTGAIQGLKQAAKKQLGEELAERAFRVGGVALQEGVFEAAQGVGDAISDSAIEDKPLTAQALLASGLSRGALGLALGGGAGAGLEFGADVLRVGNRATREMAQAAGAKADEVATGLRQGMADDVLREKGGFNKTALKDIKKRGRDKASLVEKVEGLAAEFGDTADEMLEGAKKRRAAAGDKVGQAVESFDSVTGGNPSFDNAAVIASARKKIDKNFPGGANKSIRQRLHKKLDELAEDGESVMFGDAWDTKKALDRDVTDATFRGEGKGFQNGLKTIADEYRGQVRTQAKALGFEDGVAQLDDATDEFSEWITIQKQIENRIGKKEPALRWGDKVTGGATGRTAFMGAMFGGAGFLDAIGTGGAAALAATLARKVMRTHGKDAGIQALEHMAKLQAYRGVQSGVFDSIDKASRAFMTSRGGRAAFAGGVGALSQSALSGKQKGQTNEQAFLEIRDRLEEFQANPNKALSGIMARVGSVASADPKLAQEMAEQSLRAMSFLADKMPKNAAAQRTANPAVRKWKPNSIELAKFARYVRAVEDPMSVISDMEKGVLSREGAEALREVYPALYERAQSAMMNELSELKDQIPYSRRLTMATLFGVSMDVSMEPETAQMFQELHAGEQEEQQQQQAAPAPEFRPKGFDNVKSTENAKTAGTRLLQ